MRAPATQVGTRAPDYSTATAPASITLSCQGVTLLGRGAEYVLAVISEEFRMWMMARIVRHVNSSIWGN